MRSRPDATSAPAPARGAGGRVVELAIVVGGVVLLAGLVARLGGAELTANLRLVGWGVFLIIGQEIFAIVANTLGWRAAFLAGRAPRFGHLLAARIAGDAVNYLTPSATLGGELVRARLLHERTSRLDVATSIAVAKLSQTIAQLAFVAGGAILLVATIPLATSVRLGVVAATVGMAAVGATLVMAQQQGMFAPLMRLATRFGRHQWLVDLVHRLERLDAEIARVHKARGRPFLVSCAWFFVGWALGALEIALMLWLLGVPVTAARALAIEALSAGIDALLFFVPGKLGTQEGGKVLIFSTLGLDPAIGLAVGVLRRIRELAWALLGLAIVGRLGLARAMDSASAAAPPA